VGLCKVWNDASSSAAGALKRLVLRRAPMRYLSPMQHTTWMRPAVVACVASLGFASLGCNDKGGGDNDNAEEAGTDGETGDGDGDGLSAWEFDPIYGVANLDDDDGDGKRDWLQPVFEGDDEIDTLIIPATAYAPGERIRLRLAGGVDGFRVWHNGTHVLGSGAGEPILEHTISSPSGDVELLLEFGAFLNYADLTLERVDADGNVAATATLETVSSPLIMNQHLQKAEHVWIIQTNDNSAYVTGYQAVLGSDLTAVPGGPYQHDRWIQDEIEFAYSTRPDGHRFDIVIDSIRDRGLKPFATDHFSMPDWYVGKWGNPLNATTFDSFGNLEASPPIDGYPFGRIYFGWDNGVGMDAVLADFLDSQTLQAPVRLPTDWLCVAHVDEIISFIPDANSAKGFKMLISNTTEAYALLEGLDPSWELGRYESAYGYATVGALLADDTLRAQNEDVQNNQLATIRARMKADFGLTEDDIIDIPTVFERLSFCGNRYVALTPGTVNLAVTNITGKAQILAVPDPFARPTSLGPADDPIAQDFVSRMPEGVVVAFLDNWYSYHLLDGEVHCGTNITRTPVDDWTTTGAELLGLKGAN
jgi:hypothetical protein